jgi:hypothetical protein
VTIINNLFAVSGPPGASSCFPVRHGRAWARGVQIFNDTLTKDKKKKILVSNESIAANATVLLAPSTSFAGPPGASGNAANPSADESAAIAPLILLVKETRSAADKCAQSKSGIHKHFERITWAFNCYAQSVDVLIQQHPDITAIAWGVISMLVTVGPCGRAPTVDSINTNHIDCFHGSEHLRETGDRIV